MRDVGFQGVHALAACLCLQRVQQSWKTAFPEPLPTMHEPKPGNAFGTWLLSGTWTENISVITQRGGSSPSLPSNFNSQRRQA